MKLKGKIILILLLLSLFYFSGCAYLEIGSTDFEHDYFIPIVIYVIFLILFGIWLFFDTRKRGKSPFWIILVILFTPPPWGIICWLVFRPPIRDL